jgi:hypothetical protein
LPCKANPKLPSENDGIENDGIEKEPGRPFGVATAAGAELGVAELWPGAAVLAAVGGVAVGAGVDELEQAAIASERPMTSVSVRMPLELRKT